MKVLVYFTLLFSVYSVGRAAESRGFFKDPAHPGKCVYKDLILPAGREGKLPDACGRILCGQESFAVIQTCGVMSPPPGCKYAEYVNIDAPYPECCKKKVVC